MQTAKADPAHNKRELQIRRLMRDNFKYYAPRALKIRPKEGSLKPFQLNKAQEYLHEIAERQLKLIGFVRILVLKGRQQGISTYIEGRGYWKTTHRKGYRTFILTHEEAATKNIFEMADRYHEHCLPEVKPLTGTSSVKELDFDKLDSGYKVGTAGSKATGRSGTTQFFHGSEVAFWPHAGEHAMGVMQTVPLVPDTEIWLESTANGIGNYFHNQWQLAEMGETDYIAVFLPWYWQDEYTRKLPEEWQLTNEEAELLDQFAKDGLTQQHLCWRRNKILEFVSEGDDGDWKFKQEYPFTAAEAFQTSGEDSLINPRHALKARKLELETSAAHLVGVDPARFGKDRTAIIHRQGRKAHSIKTHQKKSTMEIAGICARILRDPITGDATDVDMMFIDIGGLGAGVYDRLVELGFEEEERIIAVNGAERALADTRYNNKRTECWVTMRDWFELPGGVDVPDLDALQSDVCGPLYSYDSSSRYVLEKKENMMKRGLRSPDIGDALAYTFAEPVAPPSQKRMAERRGMTYVPVDDSVGY